MGHRREFNALLLLLLLFTGPTVWNSLPEDMRDPQTVTDSH